MRKPWMFKWTLAILIAIFSIGLAACGDDDDDENGPSLDSLVNEAHDALREAEVAFWSRICDCAIEEGMYDSTDQCDGLRGGEDFSEGFKPENITDCDRQVFTHYKDELPKALGCLKTSVAPALKERVNVSCETLFNEDGGDDLESSMESCFPGFESWSEGVDSWVISNNLRECVGIFTPDEE